MKKTLMKSLLLAVFALATQSVCAQGVVANIQPNMSNGQKFFFDEILYEITAASGSQYDVKAIGFYCEGSAFADAVIEIIGNGEANGASFTVTEIEALNAVYKMQGSDYVAGSASLADIELIKFVNEDNNGFAGTIKAGAFANLSGLTDIEVAAETPCAAESGCFDTNIKNNVKLSVPAAKYGQIAGKYANAPGWSEVKRLYTIGDEFAFGDVDCNNNFNSNDASLLKVFAKVRPANEGSFDQTINLNSIDIDGNGNKNSNDASVLKVMIKNRARKK